MTLVTLQRHAPVAPYVITCRLCGAKVEGRLQDHVLIGQPGTAEVRATICTRCGDTIERLIAVCEGHVDLRIQDAKLAARTSTAPSAGE
jgi:hypothetical protein